MAIHRNGGGRSDIVIIELGRSQQLHGGRDVVAVVCAVLRCLLENVVPNLKKKVGNEQCPKLLRAIQPQGP